ncbi:MAG: hypothetical protein ACI8YD_001007, partial [Rheinheimera aquimaris]
MIANSVIYAINESAYIILDGTIAAVNEKHLSPGGKMAATPIISDAAP